MADAPQIRPINQPRVLVVEGKDEIHCFSALVAHLKLSGFQIITLEGKGNLRDRINRVRSASGFAENAISLGVIRDADQNATGAFESVADALRSAGFQRPSAPGQFFGDSPRVGVLILSADGSQGMLEDLCLQSVADDLAMSCVDDYFACLREHADKFPANLSKARVRAFLTSREMIETGHYEQLRGLAESQPPGPPVEESLSRLHTFLASRYKPDLDLGRAAEAGYWNFDHPVFDRVKDFLRAL